MSFTTIISEGNLIPADLLAQIAAGEAEGQQPADFGLERSRRLSDEIAAAWADAKAYWEALQRSLRRLRDDDPATTVTRERWVVPLMETLGYKLTYQPTAAAAGGRTYPISHRVDHADGPPVHIEGIRRSLDQRGPGGRARLSPHALLQEYLNATEQLWGVVTNGERLRLLRDSSRTVRPIYVEFDLRAMLEGEKFSEFALLFRLLHRTRLPGSSPQRHKGTQDGADASVVAPAARPEDCLLERYHQQAIEAGGRVRDGLRDGVELALRALGDGLLRHPASAELRRRLGLAEGTPAGSTRMPADSTRMGRIDADPNQNQDQIRANPSDPRDPRADSTRMARMGRIDADPNQNQDQIRANPSDPRDPRSIGAALSPQEFYRQLLRLVYRLLFLMVAEERKLVGMKDERGRMKEESPDLHPSSFIPHPLYYDHYAVSRLRRLAEQSLAPAQGRHGDLWLGLLATFRLLEDDEAARALGVAALDGDLFGPQAMPDLAGARLDNLTLLRAIRALSLYRDPQGKALRRVNYAALDVEELGSVYESLLDYRPVITSNGTQIPQIGRIGTDRAVQESAPDPRASTQSAPSASYRFDLVAGTERKTTGSYYTRPELVHELIKSALEPVIAERLRAVAPGTRSTRIERIGADRTTEDSDQRASAQSAPSAFYRSAEEAILSIRVCDPAAGSGHFLLAAARRLGRELARVRAGEDQPAPSEYRRAVRDVIARCIYAVDLNPLAVDLCKVALWLESLEPGKPLSFLDSKVRWGNSLVGATRALVEAGVPDDAFKPVTGDDKAAAGALRKRNKKEREAQQSGQLSLGLDFAAPDGRAGYASSARALNAMPDDSVAAVRAKARQYQELRAGAYSDIVRFNLWTAAFFSPLRDADDPAVPTSAALDEWAERPLLHNLMVKRAFELAQEVGFFHWELEFPDVFGDDGTRMPQIGRMSTDRTPEDSEPRASVTSALSAFYPGSGFDVVLGNPPWERIKLQEQEHFVDVPEIAGAANKAAREKAIAAWRNGDERQRARIAQFDAAKYRAEAESRFVRASGRFPLTAVGDVNTYALFAEHSRTLLAPTGRAGIIVPTGIATDDSYKQFFSNLTASRRIISLFDFENRENLFPGVGHGMFKFSLVTMGQARSNPLFCFYATNTRHLADSTRSFTLSLSDISLINPNTQTCPIFRTGKDANITKKIYQSQPVLVSEVDRRNTWGITFFTMFHMANDSNLFQTKSGDQLLSLYEAKYFHQFNHRWSTFAGMSEDELRAEKGVDFSDIQRTNPTISITPRYWVRSDEVKNRLAGKWSRNWLIGYRRITKTVNERTVIVSILPLTAAADPAMILLTTESSISMISSFFATLNSLIFDYIARQKLGGTDLRNHYFQQFAILPPDRFSPEDIAFIVPRVMELVYTAWDIKAFAEDVWAEADEALRGLIMERRKANHKDTEAHNPEDFNALCLRAFVVGSDLPPPFIWHEGRRAIARAELDARIARLYGLTRDELRYILDPADVYGPEFPGETFRVLKEKETKLYGEYRTRRLVLEAWDREEAGR